MTFLLVPHEVEDTSATIWVGAIDEEIGALSAKLEYSSDSGSDDISLGKWEEWRSYRPGDRGSYLPWDWVLPKLLGATPRIRSLHYQRVRIERLNPRTTYSLKLRAGDGHPLAGSERRLTEARVTTLPTNLPAKEEKPFTLLLGSCFYSVEDPEGMVGRTYRRINGDEQPDVKVFSGDQVYLDNPWQETTLDWYRAFAAPGSFRDMLFQKYVDNWTQVKAENAGFRRLLEEGANYFCSDDHEFWNNAPNFGGAGMVNTLTKRQREWWFGEATTLFRAFQSPSAFMKFEVHPLSVCIIDTRINRDPNGQWFMRETNLKAVGEWVESLEGPGVMVVGQPVLAGETGILPLRGGGVLGTIKGLLARVGSFSFDRNLPDYHDQYKELIGYIKSSTHSMVVLTGDVHFGRVAHGELKAGSNKKFVEIISSPMQAVLKGKEKPLFGSYRDAPTENFPRLESLKIMDRQNHFATVRFSSGEGDEVDMRVKYWPILRSESETNPEPEVVFQISLP